MISPFTERRRFERLSLDNSLIFSDGSNLIGMAQVLDLSKSGVRCVSMSPVNCTIGMLEGVELFGAEENLELSDLSGRMTRCSDNLVSSQRDAQMGYYEFGFEFFPRHYPQISRLKSIIQAKKR
ncbi:MAG: PilZ domain-containing protein [Desulfofustis sp.]|jgi:hypothetical protein|nr:PilZ domain-containing protein [Desulfofustis sp.]